jgi:hypothetical protein
MSAYSVGTLILPNLTSTDAGKYTCELSYINPDDETRDGDIRVYNFSVTVKPSGECGIQVAVAL